MVEGCDGLMGDHGSWVKVTLLPVEKKGGGCGQADISLPGFGAGSPKSCQSRENARFHAAFGAAGIA